MEITPEAEKRMEAVLADAFHGLHHVPNIKKGPLCWTVNHSGDCSTYDFNTLTLLVLAAHRYAVRVCIKHGGPRMIKIVLHPRQRTVVTFSAYHPTIEQAIQEYWPSAEEVK